VTVTGTTAPVRSSVDRLSYSVANDLQTATGSVADALRNVPGVEVDPQGNVSLRGDSNVTIMIDGRPSALLRGEGRADALQQMGAQDLERVEVITNPSAAMSPEGTAGVINLVTKKTRRAGKTGTVRASVGTEGRANVGASGSYSTPKLTVSADAGFRKQGGEFTSERLRQRLDPATGAVLDSSLTETLSNQEGGGFANARLGVDYDPNPQDRFSLEASLFSFGLKPDGFTSLEARNAAGVVTRATRRDFENEFGNENKSVRLSWRHRFSGGQTGNEHELTVDATADMFDNFNDASIQETSLVPPGPDAFERNRNTIDRDENRLKVEYARPLAGEQKLRVGYEGALSEVHFDFQRRRGASPSTIALDPIFSNAFAFDQDVHAVYGTYERPHGDKLTVQYGLRVEQAYTTAASTTLPPFGLPFRPREENDYFRVYPTLNLGYDLDDTRRIRAGYSRRVQRPQPFDLNPFPIFIDEQNYRTGNPDLEPEVTDSFEAAFQYRRQSTFYLATLFYRQASGGITDIVFARPGGVFETTRANLAESRRVGLELVANGRITPKLTYNASATIAQVEIEPTGFGGITEGRSGTSVNGRLSLSYNPTAKDFLQLSGFVVGEQLQAQGVREPAGMLNFGYRRKVDEKLSLVFSAQNILDTFTQRTRIDTPVLRERFEQNFLAPAAFVGFTYSFGDGTARRRPEPTFEFEQGGGGGAPPT
jgi:outer membrane receptor protein involved in Fe transport